MRYIPSTGSRFVLQVPEDKNSYINVKNLNARGLATIFEGRISNGVISGSENQLTFNEITDGEGLTFEQYRSTLSQDVELQVFSYRNVASTSTPDTSIIGISSHQLVGVDFSDQTSGSNDTVGSLKYYIFGYNVRTGQMPFAVETIGESPEYNGVLDPSRWNEDQYVDIRFNRSDANVLPVIYRSWKGTVEFLGVIGNNKIGSTGTLSFKDFGNRQIPSWNQDVEGWTPSFFDGVIQVIGSVPTQRKRIIGKELLKIRPIGENAAPNYIICETVNGGNLQNGTSYQVGDDVRFVIDDTKPIRDAIDIASTGNIKEIFFPAGTYYFRDSSFENSSQRNYSNLSFRGVGEGSVIKRVPSAETLSASPGLLNFNGSGVYPIRGIRFRSMVLDGSRADTGSVSPAGGGYEQNRYIAEGLLNVSYANDVSVTECRFIDAAGPGFHAEYSTSILLIQNIFSRLGRSYETTVRPIEIFETDNNVIQGNIFEFCTAGPYFFGVEFSTINNNIVRSCGDDGVVLETSFQWNATTNLAYSDSDSLIKQVDQYNNEYSKAPIEIRRGTPLEPIYLTVTNGGEAVGIIKDSIQADIFKLDAEGRKNASQKIGSFRVLQTSDQLEAGIFSITLPGTNTATVDSLPIPATQSFSLLDPSTDNYGYMYEIKATVLLGGSGGGLTPVSIRETTIGSTNYLAIRLRNSSELLSFIIFDEANTDNDEIIINGYTNTDSGLSGWDEEEPRRVLAVDTDSNSLLIAPIANVTPGTGDGIDFSGGQLFILRDNYQVADGNIIVQ